MVDIYSENNRPISYRVNKLVLLRDFRLLVHPDADHGSMLDLALRPVSFAPEPITSLTTWQGKGNNPSPSRPTHPLDHLSRHPHLHRVSHRSLHPTLLGSFSFLLCSLRMDH